MGIVAVPVKTVQIQPAIVDVYKMCGRNFEENKTGFYLLSTEKGLSGNCNCLYKPFLYTKVICDFLMCIHSVIITATGDSLLLMGRKLTPDVMAAIGNAISMLLNMRKFYLIHGIGRKILLNPIGTNRKGIAIGRVGIGIVSSGCD